MKVNVILVVATMFVASCVIPETVKIPEPPYLEKYVDFRRQSLLAESQCPDIRGIYSLAPAIMHHGSSDTRSAVGDRLTVFTVWPFHIAGLAPAISLEDDAANLQEAILVSQPSSEELLVEVRLIDDESKAAYRFSAAEGDFECNGGVLKFPLRTYYGGLEGAILNGQVRSWIARTDNAMLILHSYGPFKSRNRSGGVVFEHEYFKFERLDNLERKK